MYLQGEICLRRAFLRRQNELSHVTNLTNSPCLRHPLPELLITETLKGASGIKVTKFYGNGIHGGKFYAYWILKIVFPVYQSGIIGI